MDLFIKWCERERVSLKRQLGIFENGTARMYEYQGASRRVEITERVIGDITRKIGELDGILAESAMPKGPKGQKRPADVIGNAVKVMRIELLPVRWTPT